MDEHQTFFVRDEQQKLFELLKYDNKLKKNNQYLRKKDLESFNLLSEFLVRIESNLHYFERDEYTELARDFLADQINADNFSYSFIAIYDGINQELDKMQEKESLELANFLKPERAELADLLANTYSCCDGFSLDPEIAMSDEEELKDCARILLLKFEQEENA